MQPSFTIQSAVEEPSLNLDHDLSYKKAKEAFMQGTVPEFTGEETLASMKAILLKAIKETSLVLIQNSRERLKRQYKLAREEMERIQEKGR